VLADDDSDRVRASAAWALNRIGTQDALEIVADYDDDRAYLVQAEAERGPRASGLTIEISESRLLLRFDRPIAGRTIRPVLNLGTPALRTDLIATRILWLR